MMKAMLGPIARRLSLACVLIVPGGTMAADDYRGAWTGEQIGAENGVRFFPDGHASNWRFHLDRSDEHAGIGLLVSGEFPDVRYLSINVYDDDKMTPVASLPDTRISHADGRFSVRVVPDDSGISGADLVRFPAGLERISVFLRYYLPQGDPQGGKALPTIEAFDTATGEALATPAGELNFPDGGAERESLRKLVVDTVVHRRIKPVMALGKGPELYSYRLPASGFYPNQHNSYLTLPVARTSGRVAVIRFKPPPEVGREGPVRYWSISLGDEETFSHWTVYDAELPAAEDGFVYLVVGDEDVDKPTVPEYFLHRDWDGVDSAVLVYRHLLTAEDYPQAIANVPQVRASRLSQATPAQAAIGEHAPVGRLLKEKTFEKLNSLASLFEPE